MWGIGNSHLQRLAIPRHLQIAAPDVVAVAVKQTEVMKEIN